MKYNHFLLLALLGIVTYSFAGSGELNRFIFWPKLLYQNHTTDLPPPEPQVRPFPQEYYAPPPLARSRKKFMSFQPYSNKYTMFLHVNEPLQLIRYISPPLEIDDKGQKLKKKKKEAEHEEAEKSRVKAEAERHKKERGVREETYQLKIDTTEMERETASNVEAEWKEIEWKEAEREEVECERKEAEESRVRAEAERYKREEEKRLREESDRLKIKAIKNKIEKDIKAEAERKKIKRKEAKRDEAERKEVERKRKEAEREEVERKRKEAEREEVERRRKEAERGEVERKRKEAEREEVERKRKEAEREKVERKRKEAEESRVRAEVERHEREEESLSEQEYGEDWDDGEETDEKGDPTMWESNILILAKCEEGGYLDEEETDGATISLDTPSHSPMLLSFEEERNIDITPLITMEKFIEEALKTQEKGVSSHVLALRNIKRSMDLIQKSYEDSIEKAREAVDKYELQSKKNSKEQQILISRIKDQTVKITSLETQINKDLPDLLRERFSKLKESLSQQDKALENELKKSRTEFEAIKDQMLRVWEEEQSLQDKLLVCEEELEEIGSQLTDVEGSVTEIKASFPLIFEDLHNPLAVRLRLLVKATLENTTQDFWSLFSGLLREKAGFILESPPSEKDINEELRAYLQRLALSAHNERDNNFIDFLYLIQLQEQAPVLNTKLTKIVEAKEALQEGISKQNQLLEIWTNHKQWHKETRKKLKKYRIELQGLDKEKERHHSVVTEREKERDTFLESYQYVLESEKFLTTPQANELAKILIKIPSCDEKESFNSYIFELEESTSELEDLMSKLSQNQAKLKCLELEALRVQEAYTQACLAQSKIEQDFQDTCKAHEENRNMKKQTIKAFRDTQEGLKHLAEALSMLIATPPKTHCDQVSEKLREDFQQLEKSFSPEGSLNLLTVPYKQWKDSHKHAFKEENLEEKITTRPLVALKSHEVLKEIW